MVQSLWTTVWRFLKKLKIELPYNSPSGCISEKKKTKALIQKGTCTPMFIAALFTIAKIRKKPTCPSTDKWIKVCLHTHTQTPTVEYY